MAHEGFLEETGHEGRALRTQVCRVTDDRAVVDFAIAHGSQQLGELRDHPWIAKPGEHVDRVELPQNGDELGQTRITRDEEALGGPSADLGVLGFVADRRKELVSLTPRALGRMPGQDVRRFTTGFFPRAKVLGNSNKTAGRRACRPRRAGFEMSRFNSGIRQILASPDRRIRRSLVMSAASSRIAVADDDPIGRVLVRLARCPQELDHQARVILRNRVTRMGAEIAHEPVETVGQSQVPSSTNFVSSHKVTAETNSSEFGLSKSFFRAGSRLSFAA